MNKQKKIKGIIVATVLIVVSISIFPIINSIADGYEFQGDNDFIPAAVFIHYGSECVFNSNDTRYVSNSFLNSTHFVVVYSDYCNSSHWGIAQIGVVSDNNITYGPKCVFNIGDTNCVSVSSLNSTHFVISFNNPNSAYATAIIGSVSGNTATFGAEYVFNSAITSFASVSALNNTHFVIAYQNTTLAGICRIGVVSGSTITFGSMYAFDSNESDYISVSSLNSTHFVVAYRNVTGFYNATSFVGIVSDNTISFGSKYIFDYSVSGFSVSSLDSTHFVVSYQSPGASCIGTVSGSTISFGSVYIFNDGGTRDVSVSSLDSTHFVVAYDDDELSLGTSIIGTVSGSTICYSSAYVFNNDEIGYTSVSSLNSTHFVVSYNNYTFRHGISIIGSFNSYSHVYVDDNADPSWYDVSHVKTIQEGINNVSSGGTVYVWNGTYVGGYVNKTVNLIGNSSTNTTINCGGGLNNIDVDSDYVNISGFKIQNGKVGIDVYANYTHIFQCNITDNLYFGIRTGYQKSCYNTTISNNDLFSNDMSILVLSDNCSICNNSILNSSDCGVCMKEANYSTISNNTIIDSFNDGIGLSLSSNNTIENNTITNCDSGLRAYQSHYNNVSGNNVTCNIVYGIMLEYSNNSIIYNNYFNNTQNAYDNGTNKWNITKTLDTNIIGGPYLGGNYWSDYAGVDTNSDGLGDTCTPYNSSGNISIGGDYLPLVYPLDNIYVDDNANLSWYDATHVHTIQEGVNNASEGGTICIWAGTYNESVTVNKSLSIIGNSTDTVTVNGLNSGTLFTINDTSYVDISEIYFFDCGTTTAFPCNYWNTNAGVKFTLSDNCNVSNCKFYANIISVFLHTSNNISIYNNTIYTYTHTSNQYGILGYYLNDTTISTNYIDCANDSEGIVLIGDHNSCGWGGYNNVIYNNTIFYPEHYGIRVIEHCNTEINKNYIYSNTGTPMGITIFSLANNSHIHNNTVYCGYGIWVENGDQHQPLMKDVLIRDNYFNCFYSYGFSSYFSDFLNLSVVNNTFIATGSNSYNTYVTSYTTNRYLNFTENILTGAGYGLYFQDTENANISSNEIYNITNDGLCLECVENASITNCTIYDCVNGINTDVMSFCSFYDNYIYNNIHGLHMGSATSNNTIYNNYFNNTNNANDTGVDNYWNTTKQSGFNIVGGPYLGGNYWNDYTGVDNDYDGIGNTDLPYNASGNITTGGDYLPLVNASYVYVDDDAPSGWYDEFHVKTIQEGVDNVSSDGTVYIWDGIHVGNVIVNKTLNLVGNGTSLSYISGGNIGNNIRITSDNVNIFHLNINDSGHAFHFETVNNVIIDDCTIDGCDYYLYGQYENTTITNCSFDGATSFESYSWNIRNLNFSHNSVNLSGSGMYFMTKDNGSFYDNDFYSTVGGNLNTGMGNLTISNNYFYGAYLIHYADSDPYGADVTIDNNTFNGNNIASNGIYLHNGGALNDKNFRNFVIANNTITNVTAEGISLIGNGVWSDINNITIYNNTITNAETGFHAHNDIRDFTFYNNSIQQCDYDLHLYDSTNFTIYNNYFGGPNHIENYQWVYDDTWNITKTLNTSIIGGPYQGGNYWSNYTGHDTTGDGLGDTPYNISAGCQDMLPLVYTSTELNEYPTDNATDMLRPPVNLSAYIINPSTVDIYFYNMTPITDKWTLLQHWDLTSGRVEVINLIDWETDFIWGNTTYQWAINVSGVNHSYNYTTYELVSGQNARYDVDNDGSSINALDLSIEWERRTVVGHSPYRGLYDVNVDDAVNTLDLSEIWAHKT